MAITTQHNPQSDSSVGVINGTATPNNLQLWVGLEDKNHYQQFSFVKFDIGTAPSGEILGWEIEMVPQAHGNGWAQSGGTNFVFGLLEPDGKWDGPDGFKTSNYATWQSYPRPTDASHVIQAGTLFQNAWLGTTLFPATLDASLPSTMSFGEGLDSDYPLTGTLPAFQAYVDENDFGPISMVFTVFEDTATFRDRRFYGRLSPDYPLVGPQLFTSVAPRFSIQAGMSLDAALDAVVSTESSVAAAASTASAVDAASALSSSISTSATLQSRIDATMRLN